MSEEIRLTRRIAAGAEEVFDAWTDAESLAQWMVPIAGGSTQAQIDARVGGRFHIDMTGSGHIYPHDGEYLRVERPRLLEFTWISNGTNRQRSIVTVELRALGADETELTLTHRLLPNRETARAHHEGWDRGLDRLVEYFAATPRGNQR